MVEFGYAVFFGGIGLIVVGIVVMLGLALIVATFQVILEAMENIVKSVEEAVDGVLARFK